MGGAATTVDKTFTARQWRLRSALLCRVFERGETSADACHWVTCDDNGKGPRFLLAPMRQPHAFEIIPHDYNLSLLIRPRRFHLSIIIRG